MNLMKHFGDILHSKLPELCISKLFVSVYVLCTTLWSARSRERRRLRRSMEHEAGGVAEGITAADCGEEGGRRDITQTIPTSIERNTDFCQRGQRGGAREA